MICTDMKERCDYQNQRDNDVLMQQYSQTKPTNIRDIGMESTFGGKGVQERIFCNDFVNKRGGNAIVGGAFSPLCDAQAAKSTFLMPTCPKNSWQNYLVCDEDKCCSMRHQTFMNVTKRSGVPYNAGRKN